MKTSLRAILPVISLGSLSACMVGPDYASAPAAVHRASFLRSEPGMTATEPQNAWWQGFADPTLNTLIVTALSANTDIAGAKARLGQARAILRQNGADRGPAGSATASYARSRPSFAQFGVEEFPGFDLDDFDLYQVGFDATWELDIFGGKRRAVEAALAQAKASASDLEDVRLSVAAETAAAFIELRSQQARLRVLTASADLDGRLLRLVEKRKAEGTASNLDLERLRAQQQATLAEIPGVRAAIDIQLSRLATLTARDLGALDAGVTYEDAVPLPPANVAIGDPSGLLRRRPDIRAAEQRLAADTAMIGVATADLFPKVTLTGNIGLAANDLGGLPKGNAFIYSAGPSISWSFLNLNRVHARIDQAGARRDEALAQYRGTIIAALNDAEASLTRYSRQVETVAARERAFASADRSAAMAEVRYREGVASTLDTLDARRQRLAAEEQLREAQADLSKAYITLQKTLGMAWINKD